MPTQLPAALQDGPEETREGRKPIRLSLIRNRLLSAVAASLVFAAPAAFAEDRGTEEAWRLFIADHTNPVMRIIDFESGKELGRYCLRGFVTASASGQIVFAAQTEADVVHAIKTGM
jgi:hypothetical protein